MFIDCLTQHSATGAEKPKCSHGEWVSNGKGRWISPTLSTWKGLVRRTRNWTAEWAERRGDYRYENVQLGWDSFSDFVRDMGPRPSREHTIDRIDSDGDYTADNCRWLLGYLNYSRGGRANARKQSDQMIDRLKSELHELETELKKEGIEIEQRP